MKNRTADIQKRLEAGARARKIFTEQTLKQIYRKKSSYWEKRRGEKALDLFHVCAKQVLAYKDFLKKAGIQADKIKTFADFQTVLPVNKENYLRNYPLEKLCADSLCGQSVVFTSTSGSTGVPFYFPRNGAIDTQSAIYHQMFLINSRLNKNKSTLVLDCFGMGVWIGGVITYQAFKTISEIGCYRLAILTPGVNKKEIFEAIKNIAPKYDQIILCGYPPFMKDVVDEAGANGVNWKKFNIKMIFAAEAFSEKFRDYMAKKAGLKNIYRDTMNIYGSADLGTMAEETPLSILIRRLALKRRTLYKKIFKEANRLPTLAQFHSDFINFDCTEKFIYCTGDNILPLIRYEIGDNGGVVTFAEVEKIFAGEGLNLKSEAKKAGIEDTIAELPFVYIYERTDLSAKFYGAIIYPEYVKAGLQNHNLEKYVTGKFTMFTEHDKKQNEYLEVNVELKPGINESNWLSKEITKAVFNSFMKKSAEYKYLANMISDKVRPKINFWPHEHQAHFKADGKQKWVKK